MGDRDAKTFRREDQSARAGRNICRTDVALARAGEYSFACRPRNSAVRPCCDMIDPAALVVGCKCLSDALGVGDGNFSVVASGDDAFAV
jgi:hypothetical protein